MTMQVWRSLNRRAAAGRLAARTRSPFTGISMANKMKRVRRQARSLVDRLVGAVRHNRAAQLALAGAAVAFTTRMLRRRHNHH